MAESELEQKPIVAGKIHPNLLSRANFLENLIFKRNDSENDDKPRKIIHTGFDMTGHKQNWEEQDKLKCAELEANLTSRVNDCNSKGLVSKMTGNLETQTEDSTEASKAQTEPGGQELKIIHLAQKLSLDTK